MKKLFLILLIICVSSAHLTNDYLDPKMMGKYPESAEKVELEAAFGVLLSALKTMQKNPEVYNYIRLKIKKFEKSLSSCFESLDGIDRSIKDGFIEANDFYKLEEFELVKEYLNSKSLDELPSQCSGGKCIVHYLFAHDYFTTLIKLSKVFTNRQQAHCKASNLTITHECQEYSVLNDALEIMFPGFTLEKIRKMIFRENTL